MDSPIAVVVGLCAHGLAITRSLSKAGIRVVALEANRSLPGVKTATAETVFVDDINGPSLVTSLISLAPELSAKATPVLLLTNDTMIETIGTFYDDLSRLYRISWGSCRTQLLPLLRKEHVYGRCMKVGMLHPRSALIRAGKDIALQVHDLKFPVILKPDKPVSAYKTLIVESMLQLNAQRETIERSLPAIAQEFIPGDDSRICFAVLYLDKGKVIARYEGRKLRSRPMGHTTVAIGERNDETHALARRFFEGLNLSGPVSLELKATDDGKYWVIEPTVGRSDFWVGLCIHDGVDLPLIEYCQQIDSPVPGGSQQDRTLWVNGERDPMALLWLLSRYPRYLVAKHTVGVYLHAADRRPAFNWTHNYVKALPGRIVRKLAKTSRLDQARR